MTGAMRRRRRETRAAEDSPLLMTLGQLAQVHVENDVQPLAHPGQVVVRGSARGDIHPPILAPAPAREPPSYPAVVIEAAAAAAVVLADIAWRRRRRARRPGRPDGAGPGRADQAAIHKAT